MQSPQVEWGSWSSALHGLRPAVSCTLEDAGSLDEALGGRLSS